MYKRQKFGLVSVAPDTFERRPKPSAHWFGEVARANRLLTAGSEAADKQVNGP